MSDNTVIITDNTEEKGGWGETIRALLLAVVVALSFRTCAFEPFHIPSGSMKSTLLVGDYLFVTKFSYGYSRFSLPWFMKKLPLHGRLFGSEPKRGDIIVFHPPMLDDLKEPFIKRLIGLPGDRIQIKDAVLYVNDKPVPKEYMDDWTDESATGGDDQVLERFKETLPNGKEFLTLHRKNRIAPVGLDVENTEVYVVPPKHYFMMGDNRDNSRDSRYPDPVSYVPEENLIGRADIILFSWGGENFLRGGRFLKMLP